MDNQQPSPQGKVQRLGVKPTSAQAELIKGSSGRLFHLKTKGGTYDRGDMEQKYIQSIVSIRDKTTQKDITWKGLEIQKIAAKYSNTKKPIYKLVIDEKPISRNNSYVVKYKCLTCKLMQEITLNLFMRKVNNDGTGCDACKNSNESKCKQQSQFMKQNASAIMSGDYEKIELKKAKDNTLEEHLIKSHTDWDIEDEEFQEAYFLTHLTIDDFERIRCRIINIGNGKITDLSGWVYEPIYRISNQTRYTPMLINKNSNQIEKPYYISFLCENCDCKFMHRDLEIVKNKLKLFCKDCSFTNKTFRIRQLVLKNNEIIMWQSVYERRFIEWCEEKNIPIQNGPKIPYMFQEKEHSYRVDFMLPQHKKIIEMKDNHCWHTGQVESGKFAAKNKCANEWAQTNGYTFHVVFPKTLSDFKTTL